MSQARKLYLCCLDINCKLYELVQRLRNARTSRLYILPLLYRADILVDNSGLAVGLLCRSGVPSDTPSLAPPCFAAFVVSAIASCLGPHLSVQRQNRQLSRAPD